MTTTPRAAMPHDSHAVLHRFALGLAQNGTPTRPRLFTAGPKGAYPGQRQHNLPIAAACFPRGEGGWPCLDTPHDGVLFHDGGWDPTHQRRPKTLPIAGATTPTVAFVFMDNSALLARRGPEGLVFCPGVLWLRSQHDGHKIAMRAGNARRPGPALLVQAHRKNLWLPADLLGSPQPHTTLVVYGDAGDPTDDGRPRHADTTQALWGGADRFDPMFDPLRMDQWIARLRADIDRFYPIFANAEARDAPFPSFLPRAGWNDDPARRAAAQAFLETLLSFGHAALGAGLLAPSLRASLSTFFAQPTLQLSLAGDTTMHNMGTTLDDAALSRMLPPPGYAAWRAAVEGEHGRAYHAARGGVQPRMLPRLEAESHVPQDGSAHQRVDALAALQRRMEHATDAWGHPTQAHKDAWHTALRHARAHRCAA